MPFHPTKRVTCVGERTAEHRRDLTSDVTRIAVVSMNQIRHAAFATKPCERAINEGIKMPPQHFLTKIATRACFDSTDVRAIPQVLYRLAVVAGNLIIKDPPRDQSDSSDPLIASQRFY